LRVAQTSCRHGGDKTRHTATPQEIDVNQNAGEKDWRGKVNALQKPLQPSEELATVIGSGPLPRGEVVSKI
jgi:chromatin remodeling complex protein RSC6